MTERDLLTLNLQDPNTLSSRPPDETSTTWTKWEAFKKASDTHNDALFADLGERRGPQRLPWLCLSLVFQALVLGVWVLRSLTASDELPPPRAVRAFIVMAPITPPPPLTVAVPSPASMKPNPEAKEVAAPSFDLAMFEPAAVPLDISELASIRFDLDDTDGRVESGVVGGVVGGLVGGLNNVALASQPVDEPKTIYVVSGELDRPDKVVHVDPLYPGIASVARVEGLVILEATIDGEGNVTNLRVLRSVPLLEQAAVDAVSQWKYEPTVIAGTPVPVLMTVTVKFALA